MIVFAGIFITLALILYTIGVWSEHRQKSLKRWHVIIFWLGLIMDTSGTSIMTHIAGGLTLNAHGLTGLLAIIIMLFHVIWATIVLVQNKEEMISKFHKFSLIVWGIWLIPIIIGMTYGVSN